MIRFHYNMIPEHEVVDCHWPMEIVEVKTLVVMLMAVLVQVVRHLLKNVDCISPNHASHSLHNI